MSGLQNFLTPYSHLIFANRDKVIVALALVLGWTVIQLLVARWRTERLERDLTAARASQSTSPARPRHAALSVVEEAPAESGGLPPIKGGRSYARNLGSALHKAGMPAAPQLYSPPVPQGWNPNTGSQPAPVQPMQPPTYAPPPAPWGPPPPAQPAAPWAYPAGATRPPFPAQPMGPVPPAYGQSPHGGPSPNPAQAFPQPYAPTGPAPFSPQFPAAGNVPEQARPEGAAAWASPPGQATPSSTAPAQAPNFATAAPQPPSPEPPSKEDGRRGKGKRRRFNLSVLDSLEKMVQPREQAATAGPAAVVAPPAQPAPAAPVLPPARVDTPSLFEPPAQPWIVEAKAAPEAVQPDPAEAEVVEAGPAPAVVLPAPAMSRPDMHSMLFGEEPEVRSHEASSSRETAPFESGPEQPAEVAEAVQEPAAPEISSSTPDWQAAGPEPLAEETRVEPEAEAEPEPEIASETRAEASTEVTAEPVLDARQAEAEVHSFEQPALMEVPGAAPAEPTRDSGGTTGGAGVLVIIEDDQAAADYYATLFRGNGYQVEVATDGVSGVDLCVRVQPQVILLDVMMPRQNGILVLQTLRASDETRNTPVVVMSNFSEPTLIKRALQLGALEYVIKTQVEGPALLSALPHWMNREKAFAA